MSSDRPHPSSPKRPPRKHRAAHAVDGPILRQEPWLMSKGLRIQRAQPLKLLLSRSAVGDETRGLRG